MGAKPKPIILWSFVIAAVIAGVSALVNFTGLGNGEKDLVVQKVPGKTMGMAEAAKIGQSMLQRVGPANLPTPNEPGTKPTPPQAALAQTLPQHPPLPLATPTPTAHPTMVQPKATPAARVLPASEKDKIRAMLFRRYRSEESFHAALGRLEDHGAGVTLILIDAAKDRTLPEEQRYRAFMAALKLGGAGAAEELSGLGREPAPFVRLAVAWLGRVPDFTGSARVISQMLNDKALVVRAEALLSAELRWSQELIPGVRRNVEDPENYSGGKALPIALRAMALLKSHGIPISRSQFCTLFAKYQADSNWLQAAAALADVAPPKKIESSATQLREAGHATCKTSAPKATKGGRL